MAKLTLTDLASLTNQTTAITTINNNNAAIETALENTLSRDGTSPNTMGASLDMNDNQIINLPEPVGDHNAATKQYVDDLVAETVTDGGGLVVRSDNFTNILDYGAVGDGTTDNRVAIELAITAAGNGWLLVPVDSAGGDYAITSGTLTIPSTCNIIYEGGARIFASGGTITNSGTSFGIGGGDVGESGRSRLTRGLNIEILGGNTGTAAVGQTDYNRIFVDADYFDGTTGGGSKVNAFSIRHEYGDSSTKGARRALAAELFQELATSTTNTDRNYCAVLGHSRTSTGDGGSATPGTGAYFGLNGYAELLSGATHTKNATAAEFNTVVNSGASTYYRSGIQIAGGGSERGIDTDAALSISNLGSVSSRWKHGILFGAQNGSAAFDVDSIVLEVKNNSTLDYLIKATGVTFTSGILVAQNVNWTPTAFQLSSTAATITNAGLPLLLTNTTDQATNIALTLLSDRATPAVNDRVGLSFQLSDSAGNNDELGRVELLASAVTAGAEASQMRFHVATGGALTLEAILSATAFTPGADGGNSLGSTGTRWNGVHLSSTSAVNWVNGDTTLTHSTGLLSLNTPFVISSGTAVPAGGTTGVGLRMSSTANLGVFFGSGAPTLSAAQGSVYMRTDGSSTSTRMYINTNGTTGWTNVTTAA